jgi:hypothetical protein
MISRLLLVSINCALQPWSGLRLVSVARRMPWAATRQTTRPEDIAYCLWAIFNIKTPLLYSERHNAFFRLQEEIIRITTFTQPLQGTSPSRLYCLHGPTVPELPPCIKYRRSIVGEGLFRRMKLLEIPHVGLPEAPHRMQVEVVEGYVIANALTCSIQSRNVAS